MALLATACGHAGDLDRAGTLAGDYSRRHRVWVFHGNEPVEVEVADRLLLAAVDGTTLDFQLEILAAGGRECRLEGRAKRRRDVFAYVEPQSGGSCELRFQRDGDRIFVIDVESRCGASQCGQDDAVGRTSFTRIQPVE